jgi:bacitracin transport system permease protein
VLELLSLIKCEFVKLKRRKIIYAVFLSAMLFPAGLSLLLKMPRFAGRYGSPAELYDELYISSVGFGIQFLLPVVLGILSSVLFFTERDNDTFKALRTVPVTSRQLVLAKIGVLMISSVLYAFVTHLTIAIFGSMFFTYNDCPGYALLTLCNGIFIAMGTLPLVILNVTVARTYVFSVLLTIFYTVISFFIIPLYPVVPKIVYQIVPITTTTFWTAGILGKIGKVNLELYGAELRDAIPSTLNMCIYMAIVGTVSAIVMVKLYERWEN